MDEDAPTGPVTEDIVPDVPKKLRACLSCTGVKTVPMFRNAGCSNCEDFLHLSDRTRSDEDPVVECTTSNFSGLIGLMNPQKSWVARYQRIDKYERGLYALKVSGSLPKKYDKSG